MWGMQLKKIKNWYNPLTRGTSAMRVNVITTLIELYKKIKLISSL